MTDTLAMSSPRLHAPAAPRGLRRVLLDSAYGFSAFLLAVPALALVVVLVAAGAGTLVVGFGFALLAGGAYVARGFAHVERVRLRSMLGLAAPYPSYAARPPGASAARSVLTPLRDPQSWLDVLWCLVGLATATFAFAVTVAWWAATLGGLSYWFWERFIPRGPDHAETSLAELIGFGESRAADIWLQTIIGAVALVTLPLAVRAAAATHGAVARVLLCSRAELQTEMARVVDTRDAARLAEAESLRRLERDIHDGPQQRLVRLTMDLGRARMQLQQDPERAGAVLDDAVRQARETAEELRSLSRGIAPPLLVDRGLAAAVEEMAAGCPVPVTTTLRVPDRLPPHVETAGYFVVAEALTNVAKHSGARSAWVDLAVAPDGLGVVVRDDGVGGAHPGKGLGLAGLTQRVAAVDGELLVSSPDGGPTVVEARIPIGPAG